MRAAVVCFTAQGCRTALQIRFILEQTGEKADIWCKKKDYLPPEGILQMEEPLKKWTGEQFSCCDALIFVGAVGITVRSIAPFLESKTKDPAVITVDEQGKFVISLLSGHIGGANELCSRIADGLEAVPVITTATDLNRKFAVDVFARKNGLWISDMKLAKQISADLLDGRRVGFYSDFPVEGEFPSQLFLMEEKQGIRSGDSGCGMLPEGAASCQHDECGTLPEKAATGQNGNSRGSGAQAAWSSCQIRVSGKPELQDKQQTDTLWLVPGWGVLGIGCRSGKTLEELEAFVLRMLEKQGISIHGLRKVCSIDRKAEEQGILDFCEKYGLPFETFSAEELMQVPGSFSASPFVAGQVGADNVCERSAVLGSGNGTLIMKKTAENGMTMAVAFENRRICFE